MATVKINGKAWRVPELTFEHTTIMEQAGVTVEGMLSRKHFFSAISAFIAIVTGSDIETACHLANQHVLGGGELVDIYKEYASAVYESAFFRKLLHLDDQEEKKGSKKSAAKTEEKLDETDQ